jgi:hypothetical protein
MSSISTLTLGTLVGAAFMMAVSPYQLSFSDNSTQLARHPAP